ncbi:uncharacterized protein LOC126986985 isoform X4 [Eriocheir sinensis]|uniref:uncharacterized protein LOC126986985 isoform X4 n=1 Tax=Eriocheir sinensis TaxID=95602 RepID=UPI0021C8D2AE|nr:uncharacterized protein LOC126986985 isoform X4 [Eriocheir sinensis]
MITFCVAATAISGPIPDDFTLVYMGALLDVPDFHEFIAPRRWESICLVVRPGEWALWLDEKVTSRAAVTKPLPLNGFLVLGQEQDVIDGGYTKEQSFQGRVTGLTLWPAALSPTELRAWTSCSLPEATPLLAWNDIQWKVHNETGDVTLLDQGPCGEGGVNTRKFLLFTSRMLLNEAEKFLDSFGFDLVVPRNEKEVKMVSELVDENKHYCQLKVKEGFGAMLGFNFDKGVVIPNNLKHKLGDLDLNVSMATKGQYFSVLQDSQGKWIEFNEARKMCFLGTPRRRMVFRLRGLPSELTEDVSPLAFSFVLARHRNHGVYFHGFKRLHILKRANSSRWCMNSLSLQLLHARLCVTLDRLPVGRHEWGVVEQPQQQQQQQQQRAWEGGLKLSLSTCADHQYTCSDATCIDLAKVCDFEFDCSDQSDEVSCTTAMLPRGYLESHPPSAPLPVLARVTVRRIINFDLLSMTFQVNVKLQLTWRDPRVTFRHLMPGYHKRVVAVKGKVWTADLVVLDAVGTTEGTPELMVEKTSDGQPNETGYVYAGAENPVEQTVDLRSTVYCKHDLWRYPWDEQLCLVRIEVTNVREGGLLLNESSGVVAYPELLEEYKVKSCTLGKEKAPTNTITVHLHLSRRYEYHLFTTFLPTSLLLILGYGTLLLPVESFNERGTMSLTTLLVFISLYTETSNSLPSTAYLKYIDVWFVFSITYLSVIIIVHLATFPRFAPSSIWPNPEDKKEQSIAHKILRAGNFILCPALVLFSLSYFLSLAVH